MLIQLIWWSSDVGKEELIHSWKKKFTKWKTQRKNKQINLTLQMKMRMICFKYGPIMLPPWTKSLFSLLVICRDSAGQSRLVQFSSHDYVAILTRATTGWTQKMYLKKTPLFKKYIFCMRSVDTYSFFYILLWKLAVSNYWI